MAITIDGVTYRNLPEQVEKNKTDIEALQSNLEGIKKNAFTDVDVTEYPTLEDFLQSTGEEGIIYLYPDGTNFKQYIWEGETWRFIGDTELDISNMVTTDTDQPISGVKTIESEIDFSNAATQNIWAVRQDQYGSLEIARNDAGLYSFANSGLFPNSNNEKDLGTSFSKWRNIYQSGKIYNVTFTVNNGASDTFIVDGANGQVKSAYTLLPISTNTADIGSSSLRWRNIYASEARVFYVGDSSNNLYMKGLVFSPDTTGSKDLGSASLKWRNIHISSDIQKAEEAIEFICPNAAALGLTLTTVATRANILNKTLNITIAFKLTNPTATAVSLGNTFEGFIKLDLNVFTRIKDMNGNSLSAIASSINPIIGKGSYQNDNGYPTEGWVYLNSLSMAHWNSEDNVNTTRFHIGFRSGPSVRANSSVNFIANIEIPLDL